MVLRKQREKRYDSSRKEISTHYCFVPNSEGSRWAMVAAAIVAAAVVGVDVDAVSDIVVCVAIANGSYRRGQEKKSAGRTTSIKIASTLILMEGSILP
jgi:hypothetical protein